MSTTFKTFGQAVQKALTSLAADAPTGGIRKRMFFKRGPQALGDFWFVVRYLRGDA